MTAYADFHRRSIEDRDGFWGEQAQLIDWHKPFEQVLRFDNPPFRDWFVGGETNLCHNAVDRHLKERADQNALIFVQCGCAAYPALYPSRPPCSGCSARHGCRTPTTRPSDGAS